MKTTIEKIAQKAYSAWRFSGQDDLRVYMADAIREALAAKTRGELEEPEPFHYACVKCKARFRDPDLLGEPWKCSECGGGITLDNPKSSANRLAEMEERLGKLDVDSIHLESTSRIRFEKIEERLAKLEAGQKDTPEGSLQKYYEAGCKAASATQKRFAEPTPSAPAPAPGSWQPLTLENHPPLGVGQKQYLIRDKGGEVQWYFTDEAELRKAIQWSYTHWQVPETAPAASEPEAKPAEPESKCSHCGGLGIVDSGGVTPWNQPIDIACPMCRPESKPAEPDPFAIELTPGNWRVHETENWWTLQSDQGIPIARLYQTWQCGNSALLRNSKRLFEAVVKVLDYYSPLPSEPSVVANMRDVAESIAAEAKGQQA